MILRTLVESQKNHRYCGYLQPVLQRRYPYCSGAERKNADVKNLTNMLYKKTRLEDTFGVNMLAVADGRPETLSLKRIIEHHVDFVSLKSTPENIQTLTRIKSWIRKKFRKV